MAEGDGAGGEEQDGCGAGEVCPLLGCLACLGGHRGDPSGAARSACFGVRGSWLCSRERRLRAALLPGRLWLLRVVSRGLTAAWPPGWGQDVEPKAEGRAATPYERHQLPYKGAPPG